MGPADQLSITVAIGAGALSFLSPCVLPIFPSYLSFVTGLSLEDMQTGREAATRRRIILSALLFILGFSLVFVSMGASFSLLGSFLYDYQGGIRRAGGVLIVLFGLQVAGWLRVPFLLRERRVELRNRPAGYLGAFLVGVTFAAGWTPCIGPILGSVLSLASTAGTARTGTLLLAAYSLGLDVPFFLSALAVDRFFTVFDRFKRFLPVMNAVAGAVLILVGALLLTNYFSVLAALANRLTPQWLVNRL